MRVLAIAMTVSFLGCTAAFSFAQQSEQLLVVLPRDAIPSIDRPEFEAAAKAKSFDNNELLIGIVGAASSAAIRRGSSIATRSSTTPSKAGRLPSPGDRSVALASCKPESSAPGR